MKQLDNDERLKIQDKAKAEIIRISNIENTKQYAKKLIKIEKFKTKFLKCERAYKIILQTHPKNKNKEYNMVKLKIDMRQVPFFYNLGRNNMAKRLIDNVKDNFDKNYTYKVINAKYTQALEEGYYLEALMITYALVEDRLRKFLYYIGLIETNDSNQLYLCEMNKQIIDIAKIKSKDYSKYKFDDISGKYKTISNIVKWVNSEKKLKSKKSYLYVLNYECESLDIAGITSTISKMHNWLSYRNEITHGLLNKNIDSLNQELESRAREGKQYFDFLSSQVKVLKKENNVRKFLKLD